MNNVVESDNNVEILSSKRCRRYKRHKARGGLKVILSKSQRWHF